MVQTQEPIYIWIELPCEEKVIGRLWEVRVGLLCMFRPGLSNRKRRRQGPEAALSVTLAARPPWPWPWPGAVGWGRAEAGPVRLSCWQGAAAANNRTELPAALPYWVLCLHPGWLLQLIRGDEWRDSPAAERSHSHCPREAWLIGGRNRGTRKRVATAGKIMDMTQQLKGLCSWDPPVPRGPRRAGRNPDTGRCGKYCVGCNTDRRRRLSGFKSCLYCLSSAPPLCTLGILPTSSGCYERMK